VAMMQKDKEVEDLKKTRYDKGRGFGKTVRSGDDAYEGYITNEVCYKTTSLIILNLEENPATLPCFVLTI
jgi:hypothetical protein